MFLKIPASGSLHLRGYLTDCEGEPVTSADVSKIEVSIFEYLDPSEIVTGYDKLSVPTSAVQDVVSVDEHGKSYNFDVNPYVTGLPMFPKRQTTYVIEVVFYDTSGKPSAHQIGIDAT